MLKKYNQRPHPRVKWLDYLSYYPSSNHKYAWAQPLLLKEYPFSCENEYMQGSLENTLIWDQQSWIYELNILPPYIFLV